MTDTLLGYCTRLVIFFVDLSAVIIVMMQGLICLFHFPYGCMLQYLFGPFQEMINIIPFQEMIDSHHSIFSIIARPSEKRFKRVPSFRENIFLLGKGRPAAVPFPASSSLTPHHFLSTGSMLGSMAASSASAVCLELTEVLGWFSDPSQRKDVLNRFITAQSATIRHPDAWAHENWVEACKKYAGSDGDGSGAIWPGLRIGLHSSGAA